jgi:hypothetical protein
MANGESRLFAVERGLRNWQSQTTWTHELSEMEIIVMECKSKAKED